VSHAAQDLLELQRLAQGGAGALTQHLLRAMANSLITPGVADARDGCQQKSPGEANVSIRNRNLAA